MIPLGDDQGRKRFAWATLALISGIAGMYAMFAKVFPTHVRATGTGFAIGIGRGGAVLAPIIAGYLLQAGVELQLVAIIMGGGALLAAFSLFVLGRRTSH